MEANLAPLVAAALQTCRAAGCAADAGELAYAACLLEAGGAWRSVDGGAPLPGLANGGRPLPPGALAAMAERLAADAAAAPDPAAAALALERSQAAQRALVEGELGARASDAARLGAALAQRRVRLSTAGLPEYVAAFEALLDYIAAAGGLAPRAAADPAARAALGAAVESVAPLSSMEALARVACGICLFNAASGDGAASPALLPPSAAAQLPQAERLLHAVEAAAAEAEAAFEQHNAPPRDGAGSAGGAGGLVVALFCCQAAVALRRLAGDLAAGIACCRALDAGIADALAQAARLVRGSLSGVAKDAVLPLFDTAGRLHAALTGELRLLLVRARLWEDARAALEAAPAAVPRLLGFRPRAGAGAARRSSAAGGGGGGGGGGDDEAGGLSAEEAAALPPGLTYVPAGSGGADDGDAAEHAGQLALGASARASALRAFVAAPEAALDGARRAAARAPLLEHLLGLAGAGGRLPALRAVLALAAGPARVDAGTQTPTHFTERHVDVDYEWNEWALRRRIIALANLRTKATHGAQTALSAFRRDGDTQTWLPKAAAAQTPVAKGSAMPRKLRYVAGLRGPPGVKARVVSLELDIGQSQHSR
ncbi:cfap206 [Scenedesmus sp. PABB004]|nr:cfap206 [Scenedesmus sp. PABB004]